MADFVKFRFAKYDGSAATAGLIMDKDKLRAMSIQDISRLFPYSESGKMELFQVSPPYGDWNSAFSHNFNEEPPRAYNVKGLDL